MTTLACTILQQSLTKNFIIQNMEKKKIGQIQGRISIRRPIRNLHTKYDNSSLHSFTEIFDEKSHHPKYGKKENRIKTGKNKQETAGSQSHDKYIIINLHTKYNYSSLHDFTEIFDEILHYSKYGKKANRTNT